MAIEQALHLRTVKSRQEDAAKLSVLSSAGRPCLCFHSIYFHAGSSAALRVIAMQNAASKAEVMAQLKHRVAE
jgi:hypothetical protein